MYKRLVKYIFIPLSLAASSHIGFANNVRTLRDQAMKAVHDQAEFQFQVMVGRHFLIER